MLLVAGAAFINDKHIVAEIKPKEEARREYREAVARGDGAYLMEEDVPVRDASACGGILATRLPHPLVLNPRHFLAQDVFTVAVGNLPQACSVVVRITYVTELAVEDGALVLRLPSSVASNQERAATAVRMHNERTWASSHC